MNVPHSHIGIIDDSHTFKIKVGSKSWSLIDFRIDTNGSRFFKITIRLQDLLRGTIIDYEMDYLSGESIKKKKLSQIIKTHNKKDFEISFTKNVKSTIDTMLSTLDGVDERDEKIIASLNKKAKASNNELLLLL